jgi:hypothetical protein
MTVPHFKTYCLVCHKSGDYFCESTEVPVRCTCGTPVCITRMPETKKALPPAQNRWNVTNVDEILADLRFPTELGG